MLNEVVENVIEQTPVTVEKQQPSYFEESDFQNIVRFFELLAKIDQKKGITKRYEDHRNKHNSN